MDLHAAPPPPEEEADQWSEPLLEPLEGMAEMLDVLRRRSGVDFAGYKANTLARRVRKRLVRLGIKSPAAYLQQLQDSAAEREALVGELLVNVTTFFRDPDVFRRLETEVLPDLLRGRDPADELRIWCAGCASGEEAYSVAMLALDAAGRLGFHGNVKVFATDLDAAALSEASRGRYPVLALTGVPDTLRRRYFEVVPDGMRTDATLRRHLVFARHNLISDPPFTCIDLVLCRNLLIYLKPQAQLKVLAQLHFALNPQGLLLLGASENVGALESTAFSVVDRTHKLFRKHLTAPQRSFDSQRVGTQSVPAMLAPLQVADLAQTPEVLAAELDATRERLHDMVHELQAKHERLDLGNEELTASNEELQSTNEELKSVNQHLHELNVQLETRNEELDALNRDYDHLLASTDIGTVFLDDQLRLRRFSSGVDDFLALRESDVGRPIGDIRYRLGPQELFLEDLARCATGGCRIEREALLPDGRWVFERFLPYSEGQTVARAHATGKGDGVVLTWTDISTLKRIGSVAGKLEAERQRLLAIMDAMPDGVCIVDADHQIEYLNPVLKCEVGEITGQNYALHFHGNGQPGLLGADSAPTSGEPPGLSWMSPRGRSFELIDIPVSNADGSLSKLALFHDVTETQNARRRLQESARIARIGHWEWHLVSQELVWSDEIYAMFGYAVGSVKPTYERFLDHIEAAERDQIRARVHAAVTQHGSYLVEFRFRRTDGTARVGHASGTLVVNPQGEPVMFWGAMQDITSLRESELLFQTAFRASPLAASITRVRDGLFVEVNDRYGDVFGWTPADLVGRTVGDVGLWADPAAREVWRESFEHTGTTLDLEAEWVCKSGERRHVSLSAERIELDDEPHVVAYAQDVTERKKNAARIEFLAHHDPLTHLPNRVLFRDRFEHAKAWCERSHSKVALLFLDLDHFKNINDSLGHPVGDQLLQQVSKRLSGILRETDTISRQGGDEFLIVLAGVHDVDSVGQTAEKILRTLDHPFEIEGHELAATVSIGIALWPEDGHDFDVLLQRADTAMYRAKESGRNACCFYTGEMNAQALENLKMRSALHWALDQKEFVLHYQPQIDLLTGAVVGVEALLRWQRSDGELVPPARFIPAAEESGQIVPIGEWVLKEACAQAVRWEQAGMPEMTMAVNLSAVQFKRGDLLASVTRALEESGLEPTRLELELTESLLLDDAEGTLEKVHRFKALGVCLSIDDFGTGYSSLAYLRRFAVDKLKIDQSFVRDIVDDPEDAAIVRAIISMARALKLRVVAEGVENEDVARVLGLYHCHEAQGYHFARPMPEDAATAWLLQYRAQPRGAR